jgi:hypothetical protein
LSRTFELAGATWYVPEIVGSGTTDSAALTVPPSGFVTVTCPVTVAVPFTAETTTGTLSCEADVSVGVPSVKMVGVDVETITPLWNGPPLMMSVLDAPPCIDVGEIVAVGTDIAYPPFSVNETALPSGSVKVTVAEVP